MEGARRPRRRTQNRAGPGCVSTRSRFHAVDLTADGADGTDKKQPEKMAARMVVSGTGEWGRSRHRPSGLHLIREIREIRGLARNAGALRPFAPRRFDGRGRQSTQKDAEMGGAGRRLKAPALFLRLA